MRHAKVTEAESARRRSAVIRHIKLGCGLPEIAVNFGISLRYVRWIAADAGLARPRGRPRGSCKQLPIRRPKAIRTGYILHSAEPASL